MEFEEPGDLATGINDTCLDCVPLEQGKEYVLFLATFDGSPAMELNPIQSAYGGTPDADGVYASVHSANTLTLSDHELRALSGR